MGDTSIDEGGGGEGSGRADDEGGDGELHGSDIQREEFVKIMIMWAGSERRRRMQRTKALAPSSIIGRFAVSSK